MKTALHLVAMPLAYPFHPSSQIGYLHGYVQATFGDRLPVRSHHAFLRILHEFEGLEMAKFFEDYSLVGEEIMYLACCLNALQHGENELAPAANFADALRRYNGYRENDENESQQQLVPISIEKLARLCMAMETFLERHIVPALSNEILNVVGFTASFCQVFGSVFAARHLKRLTDKPILFLFGGSSYSLPEGTRTLATWGIEGLIVAGSGEAPLSELLEACLDLSPEDDPVATLSARTFTNVHGVGEPHKPVDLSMPARYMETLPDPNYDDYFADLRRICSDEHAYRFACEHLVSIPIEGSRGCFAKCDFCHNPNITSQFRSLTGERVAQRTLALVDRYSVPDVTFVDSVSNTWAEGYADHFLARGAWVKAFMELRVHAPEFFWTKLALSGATALQLGIEALSVPLLTSMRKGTTVMQNLAASKYMAELGIRNASNLIIHHPRSTLADVHETKRVMSLLEHFPIFLLSRFVVSYASPLYNELHDEQKAQLHRGFDWLPQELEHYGWPRHLSYTWPNTWMGPGVVDAWLDFQRWYSDHVKTMSELDKEPSFNVYRDADQLQFRDSRFGQEEVYHLSGLDARIYDACHQPCKVGHLAPRLGVSESEIQTVLTEFTDRRVLIRVEDHYLSLAFRPRSELIERLQAIGATPQTHDLFPSVAKVYRVARVSR